VLRVPGAANSALSDAQLAAVLNWLAMRYSAAEERPPASFTAEEVARVRRTPLANVKERRREVIRGLAASGDPRPRRERCRAAGGVLAGPHCLKIIVSP